MAEPKSDDDEVETVRKACTLALTTIDHLKKLSARGTHGIGVPGVMSFLIMQGVQRAMDDGYLPKDAAPTSASNPSNSG